MAWIAAVAGVASTAISANAKKSAAGISGPSMDARSTEAVFDNSGWNINFGSGKIDSTAVKTVDQAGSSAPNGTAYGDPLASMGQMLGGNNNTLIYAALAGVFLLAWKRKKS